MMESYEDGGKREIIGPSSKATKRQQIEEKKEKQSLMDQSSVAADGRDELMMGVDGESEIMEETHTKADENEQ